MKLVKNSIVYELPTLTKVSGFDFDFRTDTEDKALQHGGVFTGDGKAEVRTLELEIGIYAFTTRAEYRNLLDEIKLYASRRGQKFYRDDDRYINIECLKSVQEDFEDGYHGIKGTLTLDFICVDPFEYSTAAITGSESVTESTQEFTVKNPGTADTPIKFTITANANNPAITLVNETDDNRTFGYQDTGLTSGKVVTIDSAEGIVKRDTTDTINDMGGTFINLLPGDNVIKYTGAAATIAYEFTSRWL